MCGISVTKQIMVFQQQSVVPQPQQISLYALLPPPVRKKLRALQYLTNNKLSNT